ncbi:MAG: tryptophan 2,3-dioxygenase family protein [Candidatus Poseidoniales archaeon]|nr:tryptophan 2,3-dioxygenase family protein [Candidatus Poseidoniales archaeon]|tara:strand:- start:1227 stop:2327 length:1101 start_codon:yes stop_codon:yes gene_type:complete
MGGGYSGGASGSNRTYGGYLSLHELLSLQRDAEGISNDEMHFIVTHQTFELWFKQVIRELKEIRDILATEHVPEAQIPKAVEHLGRVTEIFRLLANQWKVMETLTPQGFLAFRDELGSASGFESYQMREMEILLGLEHVGRVSDMDPLAHFRKLASRSEADAIALARLEATLEETTLVSSLTTWLSRTPIMGSFYGSEGDSEVVEAYVDAHLSAYSSIGEAASARMEAQGVDNIEAVKARFEAASQGARDFLKPDGDINRARAGLLFIESYRELPLLAWPRVLVDAVVELEESMVLFRTHHARMVERIIGRRVGTGGSSGVDYLDATTKYRIFGDLWGVRTILLKPELLPALQNGEMYGFAGEDAN